jgi:hypothetical protein
MKLEFLRLNAVNRPSRISEGVIEIRILYNLATVKLDSMTLEPYPSAVLPCNTLTGIRRWPPHYPSIHPLSMVGCRPT